jgi:hypothetical protein
VSSPPPAERLDTAVNVATAASHSFTSLKRVWRSVATPCPIPGNAKERYFCTTSPNTAHGNPRKLFCRAACYCRHPEFETAFDDTNDVPAPLLRLSYACICLSFVVSCRCNCAITLNGSSLSIDADQPSTTCDRRYESEVVAMYCRRPDHDPGNRYRYQSFTSRYEFRLVQCQPPISAIEVVYWFDIDYFHRLDNQQ